MRSLVIIAHDIRSTHNIGSILRTADGFGVEHVYFTGITPYPKEPNDTRLPHISNKLTNQINKTALGAIDTVNWSYHDNILDLITALKINSYQIVGLEQSKSSISLNTYNPQSKIALLLGSEVEGLNCKLQKLCDELIEITMYGKKESFNVAQATAIALYALRET